MKENLRPILINIAAIILIFIAGFFLFHSNAPEMVKAGTSDNVSGFAWSENIGWISFNCTNTDSCAASNYGININTSTGAFSGYGWSENIGWIDFSQVMFDINSFKVSGRARALSYGNGWDGWIKLAKSAGDSGRNYEVLVDKQTGDFQGWAWGSDVVGWVSFNGPNYKVVTSLSFNRPPNKPGLDPDYPDGETWEHCAIQGLSVPIFHWAYSDPDNDPQAGYEIWVDDSPGFPGEKFNHLVEPSASTAYSLTLSQDDNPADWLSQLIWGETYHWRVKVKDNQNTWSGWSEANSFTMPSHPYPFVDFQWESSSPTANELIQFTDQTVFYDGAGSWNWDFGDSLTSILQNPTHSYSSAGSYTVSLQATDSDSYSCSASEQLSAELPLPEWQEVAP